MRQGKNERMLKSIEISMTLQWITYGIYNKFGEYNLEQFNSTNNIHFDTLNWMYCWNLKNIHMIDK